MLPLTTIVLLPSKQIFSWSALNFQFVLTSWVPGALVHSRCWEEKEMQRHQIVAFWHCTRLLHRSVFTPNILPRTATCHKELNLGKQLWEKVIDFNFLKTYTIFFIVAPEIFVKLSQPNWTEDFTLTSWSATIAFSLSILALFSTILENFTLIRHSTLRKKPPLPQIAI